MYMEHQVIDTSTITIRRSETVIFIALESEFNEHVLIEVKYVVRAAFDTLSSLIQIATCARLVVIQSEIFTYN